MIEKHADFRQRAVVHSKSLEWIDSPMPGVRRRLLDRIGGEIARATTIVSYAPGSKFSSHVHKGGEEFLVLEGVFQDENGDYPMGTYIRNPPESSHTPGSDLGCVIFVKLWQFDLSDRTHICTQFDKIGSYADANQPGILTTPLYEDVREQVFIQYWSPGATVVLDASGGLEVFVVEGGFEESGEMFQHQSWLRVPVAGEFSAKAGPGGTKVWIKTGHLRYASPPGL